MVAGTALTSDEDFGDLRDLTGRVIADRYQLTRFISAGGFGAVYEATDGKFVGKKVAVKLCIQISSEHAFLREAQLLGALNHDNIVRVSDQGVHRGIPYIVMELLAGESVGHLLNRNNGRMPLSFLLRFVRDVGKALSHAHKHHLVHRDLKPNNVLLVDTGDAEEASRGACKFVLLDFGIAAKTNANNSLANKTFAGAGTPEYMAPEQVKSLEPSEQTDIYTFGVLLFQMLTGKLPFPLQGDSYADIARVMTSIVDAKPPRPSTIAPDAKIPTAIDDLILECLEKDPGHRPRSVNDVRRRFLKVYEPNLDTARNTGEITLLPGFMPQREGNTSGTHSRPGTTTVPAPLVLPLAMILSIIFAILGGVGAIIFLPAYFTPKAVERLAISTSVPELSIPAGSSKIFAITIDRLDGEKPVELSAEGFPAGVTHDMVASTADKSVNVSVNVGLNAKTGPYTLKLGGELQGSKGLLQAAPITLSLKIQPPPAWLPPNSPAGSFRGTGEVVKLPGGRVLFRKLECQVTGSATAVTLILIDSESKQPKIAPFYIMETKVPQGLMRLFLNGFVSPKTPGLDQDAVSKDGWQEFLSSATGTAVVPQGDQYPAMGVTPNEAYYFCKWLAGEELGKLPSRQQWWAAAGYYDRAKANSTGPFRDLNGIIPTKQPAPVGTSPDDIALAFGCKDMAGNGSEWTSDTLLVNDTPFPVKPGLPLHIAGTALGLEPCLFDVEAKLSLEFDPAGGGGFSPNPPMWSEENGRKGISFRAVLEIP